MSEATGAFSAAQGQTPQAAADLRAGVVDPVPGMPSTTHQSQVPAGGHGASLSEALLRIALLEGLLRQARQLLDNGHYQVHDFDEYCQLLDDIDLAIPPAPRYVPAPPCAKSTVCTRPEGHPGECDDLPF